MPVPAAAELPAAANNLFGPPKLKEDPLDEDWVPKDSPKLLPVFEEDAVNLLAEMEGPNLPWLRLKDPPFTPEFSPKEDPNLEPCVAALVSMFEPEPPHPPCP